MIRIARNGIELELEPDTTLDIEWESWLFSEDEGVGKAFSYPISFPLSDNNRIFLDHRHLVQRGYVELDVSVKLYNFFFTSCKLSYRIEGYHKASGHLKLDESEINSKLRDKTLQDIISDEVFLGTNQIDVRGTLFTLALAEPAKNPVVFAPVYAPNFIEKGFEAPGFVQQSYINCWGKLRATDMAPSFWIDATYPTTFLNIPIPIKRLGFPLVPFPYLTWTLRKIFDWLGLSVRSQFLENPEIKARVLYNNVAINNLFDSSSLPVPRMRFKVADHLPRMKVLEFLKAIKTHFRLQLDFDVSIGEVVIRSFAEIQEADDYQDLSRWLTAEDIILDPPKVQGYTIKYEDNDPVYKEEVKLPEPKIIGTGEKSVSNEIGFLPMRKEAQINSSGVISLTRWLVPVTYENGNLQGLQYRDSSNYVAYGEKLKTETKLRLMAYRGIQKDSAGNPYPLLTSSRYDYVQSRIGELTDDPEDSKSVYEIYQKPYYTFLSAARSAQLQLLMPVAEFLRLQMYRKVGIKGRDRVLVKYAIEKMVTALPGFGGEVPVKLYAYPILPGEIGPNTVDDKRYVYLWLEIAPHEDDELADVWVRAYTTKEKSRPLTVAGLVVSYQSISNIADARHVEELSFVMNGNEFRLFDDFQAYYPPDEFGDYQTVDLELLPSPNYFIIT